MEGRLLFRLTEEIEQKEEGAAVLAAGLQRDAEVALLCPVPPPQASLELPCQD